MPRRPRQSPVPRLDWRDPNMPVLREYRMPNGKLLPSIDPAYESRYREHLLNTSAQPLWTHDPTYNLRRPKP